MAVDFLKFGRVMVFFALLLLITAPARTYAGWFMLTVSDDKNAPCTQKAHEMSVGYEKEKAKGTKGIINDFPILTAQETVEDLKNYFTGKPHNIVFLFSAFQNGHVSFCTKKEKTVVMAALVKIFASESMTPEMESSLYDLIWLFAKNRMVKYIDEELKSPALDPEKKKKLNKLKKKILETDK